MFFLHFLKISSLLLSGAFQTEALYFQKLWLFLIFPLINILRWSWQERDLLSWIPEWTTLESSASQAKTSTKSWSKQNTGGRKQEMRGGLLGKLWGALCRHQRAFISWARKGWCRWAFRSATSAGPRKPEQVLLHPNTTHYTAAGRKAPHPGNRSWTVQGCEPSSLGYWEGQLMLPGIRQAQQGALAQIVIYLFTHSRSSIKDSET